MFTAKRAALIASRVEFLCTFRHHGTFMYSAPILLDGDTNDEPNRSNLVLFEDGVPLRRPHEQHSTISGTGRGSYSHWERTIFFSTSDNSDPNANGRSYSYGIDKDEQETQDDEGTVTLHPPFALQAGLCWGTAVEDMGEDNFNLMDTRLQLFEDDRPLGPSRASHSDIAEVGGGSYSHWKQYLYFSTSDGSDPNTNGRIYTYNLVE